LIDNLIDIKKGFFTSELLPNKSCHTMLATFPLNLGNNGTGYILAEIDTEKLFHLSIDNMIDFGSTGKIKVFFKNGNKIETIYNSNQQDSSLKILPFSTGSPYSKSTIGSEGFEILAGRGRHEKIISWTSLSIPNTGLIVEVDKEEAYGILNSLYFILFSKWIAGLIIAFSLAIIFYKIIRESIAKLILNIEEITVGIKPHIETGNRDIIGKLSHKILTLSKRVEEVTRFTKSLKENDTTVEKIVPLAETDEITSTLLLLQEELKDVHNKDAVKNWIVTGLAELAMIMRAQNNLDDLTEAVCKYVYHRVSARQTSLYLFYKDRLPQIELSSAYAYGKKKFLEKYLKVGQGYVGKTVFENQPIFLTEVSDDYEYIKSGLSETPKPKSAFLVPLKANEMLIGVLEINADHIFTERERSFVEDIAEMIAQTIFSMQVNKKTKDLLDEISNAQAKLQALLVNASEIIVISDIEGSFTYVSPNITKILGYEVEDLIDTEVCEMVYEEDKYRFDDMLVSLVNTPDKVESTQIRFNKQNGDDIWIEILGKNMLKDAAIKGLVLNLRDITERKRAEDEEKKRGQMQALSENSLDIITRISTEEVFFYVNPAIQKFTDEYFMNIVNKHVDEAHLHETLKTAYKDILDKVLRTRQNQDEEYEIEDLKNTKFDVHLNAIPEFNDDFEIESVLVVAHDITERKAIERDIQEKNKKIEESINYAKMIQSTIIPSERLIKSYFPESFMMFKPKDVVSGDFPWMYVQDDVIYLSAVDCTGHGVPGAMISFVGYFLLNHAIKTSTYTTPAEIMDDLDKLVVEAFRQNSEDAKIKDGMDMGLIRVDFKTNEVQYAGAHRPMYHIKSTGELDEIKGDKFPMGGGDAFKNKTNFTNTVLKMEKGDTIYFFSDGLPDQFGGPDNRKLGPKRIKEFVVEKADKPIGIIQKEFENMFEDWKGNGKQTDDVLVFGIRF